MIVASACIAPIPRAREIISATVTSSDGRGSPVSLLVQVGTLAHLNSS